jgi:hypothetical protein
VKGTAAARASWASWARPKAGKWGDGHARGSKRATGDGGLLGFTGRKARERMKLFFFFLFKYFKAFSNDFESSFEFESNHSIQKFKCNSISAQTCFYPYI